MESNKKDRLSSDQDFQGDQHGIVDFSAPRGSIKSGRLIIASEAKWLVLKAGPPDDYLYQARFWHFAPHIGQMRMS
jgi:hypothetical protein